jgi:hypothetical protein
MRLVEAEQIQVLGSVDTEGGRRIPREFPVFPLHIREFAAETSSLQTATTAIWSAVAETSGSRLTTVLEDVAIPRGFGDSGRAHRNRRLRVLGAKDRGTRARLCDQVGRFGAARDLPPRQTRLWFALATPDAREARTESYGCAVSITPAKVRCPVVCQNSADRKRSKNRHVSGALEFSKSANFGAASQLVSADG